MYHSSHAYIKAIGGSFCAGRMASLLMQAILDILNPKPQTIFIKYDPTASD